MKRTPLKRSAPLRSREPARGGGRKPTKRKRRTPSEFRRIYGSKERVGFVKSLPCANCNIRDGFYDGLVMWAVVNAHVRNSGTGRKGPYTAIIPLCETPDRAGCHDVQHDVGWLALSALDTREKREAAATRTEELWQSHLRQTGRARQDAE